MQRLSPRQLYILMAVREIKANSRKGLTRNLDIYGLMRTMGFYKFNKQDMDNIYDCNDIDWTPVEWSMQLCFDELQLLVDAGFMTWHKCSDELFNEPDDRELRLTKLGFAQTRGFAVPVEIRNHVGDFTIPACIRPRKKIKIGSSIRCDLAGLAPFESTSVNLGFSKSS